MCVLHRANISVNHLKGRKEKDATTKKGLNFPTHVRTDVRPPYAFPRERSEKSGKAKCVTKRSSLRSSKSPPFLATPSDMKRSFFSFFFFFSKPLPLFPPSFFPRTHCKGEKSRNFWPRSKTFFTFSLLCGGGAKKGFLRLPRWSTRPPLKSEVFPFCPFSLADLGE